jgi:hypothetical protein
MISPSPGPQQRLEYHDLPGASPAPGPGPGRGPEPPSIGPAGPHLFGSPATEAAAAAAAAAAAVSPARGGWAAWPRQASRF